MLNMVTLFLCLIFYVGLSANERTFSKAEIETYIIKNFSERDEKFNLLRSEMDLCKEPTYLYHVKESCGSGGCEYHIVKEVLSRYEIIGSFFGHYQVEKKKSKGCYDIKILPNRGMESGESLLRFDGKKYVNR